MILKYIFNIFLSFDQFINTLLAGHPDETLSSRLGRTKGDERYMFVYLLRIIVDCIFFFDYKVDDEGNRIKHCEKSILPLEQKNFKEFIDYELWSWNKSHK